MLALLSGGWALMTGVADGRTDIGGGRSYTNMFISIFCLPGPKDAVLTPSGAVENHLASPADIFAAFNEKYG